MQRSFTFVPLLVVCLLCIGPVIAQDAPTPEPVGLCADAPQYAVHGPYWVGTRDFVLDPDSERPLTITAWYPALNPEGLPEETTYTIFEDCAIRAQFPDATDWTIRGHALANAAPDGSGGPYPLVIYSHGQGGWRSEAAWSTEQLASMGFVVLAADHEGESPWESSFVLGLNRVDDIQRLIAYAEQLTSENGELANQLDTDRIGVIGWSTGGTSALTAGGAQYDLKWLDQQCATNPGVDPSGLECSFVQENRSQLLAMAGLAEEPEGVWPSFGDPRVQAIVDRSGDNLRFGPEGLASVTVPLMVLAGTLDSSVPVATGAQMTYDDVSSSQKALALFQDGDHMLFENACHTMPWVPSIQFEWFCSDAVWDLDRAHDLINHFTTAFLLSTLKGDVDATAALSPDAVSFPGIEYEAEGF